MALILPNTIQNDIDADGDKLGQNFNTITDWANQEAITRDGATGMTAPLLLPGAPTQPNQAATKAYVDSYMPVGAMTEYLGQTEPAGWMFCRGQELSRATYAALFGIIGTTYGTGNGSTTFNIPAMQGRSPMGYWPSGSWASTPGMIGSEHSTLPSHQHGGVDHLHGINMNTSNPSGNHTHSFSGGTYSENAQHYHGSYGGQAGVLMSTDNGNPIWIIADGGSRVVYAGTTHYEAQEHQHGFAGRTDGVSDWHVHAVNGQTGAADRSLTTAHAGSDATNANIHPVVVLNFIVKVT